MSGLESLYQDLILDHAKRKVGSVTLADLPEEPGAATSHQRNPICGDEVSVRVVVAPAVDGDAEDGGAGERVASLVWEGLGCSISQASSSMLAELADGLPTAELERLTEGFRTAMRSKGALPLDEEEFGDAAALSGVSRYTARVKCAMLPWVALEDAVRRARASSPAG